MDQLGIKTLENVAESVEKVQRKSKQKKEVNANTFFMSTLEFAKKAELEEPAWGRIRGEWVDNRLRDEWLSLIVQQEPHLESVLSTSITLDANRRYKLIGGRNQVLKYIRRFDNFENGQGFRRFQELQAKDYYNADVGTIGEIERDGRNGPLLSLYHVDPTKVRLGKDGLLKYEANDIWQPDWYYRLSSQKSTLDKYNQLGRCAVSRCLKLAQTMIALVTHNLEKLGYLAPNGILFISAEDITQDMWDEAIAARKAVYITNTGNQYFDQLMTVIDQNVSADLVEFSKMPEKFDTFMFTDYMLKGYALAFNRDVRTFWSLNSGNFGGGTEAALQDEKSTYGGAAEFILAFQDQFRRLLPQSLYFEYEVEDTRGKLSRAQVDETILKSAKLLAEVGLEQRYVLSWLADQGVIPTEWTEEEEDVVAEMGVLKERNILRQRFLDTEEVQRAIERFPTEPIVMYESAGEFSGPKITRLWDTGKDAIQRSWFGFDSKTRLPERDAELRRKKRIQQYKREVSIADFPGGSRGNWMYAAGAYTFLDQIEERDENEEAAYLLLLLLLNRNRPIEDSEVDELDLLLSGILIASMVSYLRDLRYYSDEAEEGSEEDYPERWDTRFNYLRQYGKMYDSEDDRLWRWERGATENSCNDCVDLDGQIRPALEWLEGGPIPGDPSLACSGFCQCDLVPV